VHIDVFVSVLSKQLTRVAENYWFNCSASERSDRFDDGTMLRVLS